MHNGRLADPLNPFAKNLKELTSKRTKTDSDHAKISELEWHGGLYVDPEGRPCVPGENIESAFVASAKKLKLGKVAQAAILSDGLWPLVYDGPTEPDALFADARFRDVRGVKVGQARVMRTRPIFRVWELKFDVAYESDDLNEGQVIQMLEIMSKAIGLGEYRPKFGRFRVVKAKAS